jgi:hypothetical protein
MVFVASYVDRRVVLDGNTALIHAHARVPQEAAAIHRVRSVTIILNRLGLKS